MAAVDKKMDIFYHSQMGERPLPNFISQRVIRGRYLFLDLDTPDSSDLIVTCAGWEECSASYEIKRDGFRYLALEYIMGGNWELETRGRKWKVGPGTVFTYGPTTSYSLKALSGGANPGCLLHRRWLQDLIEQLIEIAHMEPSSRTQFSKMLAPLILQRVRADLRAGPHFSHAQQSYEQCRRYLADHYLQIKSLSDAARACGLSSAHLSRLFHRFAIESPNQFLVRMKMNHAAELIARSSVPVKSAANSVGYDDPYHFSRVFKRVHGVAPSHFCNNSPP